MNVMHIVENRLSELQVAEAIALYKHLLDHPEVRDSPHSPGVPMCKICNKTAERIRIEQINSSKGRS